jgi:hypothetical protein
MKDTSIQIAPAVFLVRPYHFGYNPETAGSNVFQKSDGGENIAVLSQQAIAEFNSFLELLDKNDIETIVADDREIEVPDAVFPNNWFSTHADGTLLIYPMLSPLRRKERRQDLLENILKENNFVIRRTIDLSPLEDDNLFVEGTGSIVFDHVHKFAFANRSSRTNEMAVMEVCNKLNYEPVFFTAGLSDHSEIYHTNVLLTIMEDTVVFCADCIPDVKVRNHLTGIFAATRTLIKVDENQMKQFACNMLQVANKKGEWITVLSRQAADSLDVSQMELLSKTAKLVIASVPVIERAGGGSVRCMMAEIFLPKK